MHYFATAHRLRNAAVSVILVALALFLPAEARAEIGVTVAANSETDARGSYYVIDAAPGQVVTQQLQIRNDADEATTIEIAAVDATTGSNGGVIYALASDAASAIGTWITLPVRQAMLAPGETVLFDFSVAIPADASPGTHVGGLSVTENGTAVTTKIASGNASVGASVAVVTRQVIAVQIDVAGTRAPSMTIESAELLVRPSGVAIEIVLKNNGTEILHPSGRLELTGNGQQSGLTQDFALGTVLPGTDAPIIVPWQTEAPLPGTYAVSIVATDETGARATWTDSVTVDAAIEATVKERVLRAPAPVSDAAPAAQSLPIIPLFGGIAGLMILWFAMSEIRSRNATRRESRNR